MSSQTNQTQRLLATLTARRAELEHQVGAGVDFDLAEMLREVSELTEQLLVADEELRAQHEELERAGAVTERLAAEHDRLFACSPEAMLHTDLDGIVVNSNRAARQLFGEREQDVTAIRPIATKFALDDRGVVRSLVSRATAGGARADQDATGQAAVRRRGGDDIPCQVTARRTSDVPSGSDLLLWTITPVERTQHRSGARGASAVADLVRPLLGKPVSEIEVGIVDAVRAWLPGSTQAALSFARRTKDGAVTAHEVISASDDQVREFAWLDLRGGGPISIALSDETPIAVADLRTDRRWPHLAPRSAVLGLRSGLAVPMPGPGNRLAALSLYGAAPGAGTDEACLAAVAAFAFHAGTTLAAADREHNLRTAIESREIIGQAIGILIERHRLTPPQAFDMLVHVSQNRHAKLRDVARGLTETGEL